MAASKKHLGTWQFEGGPDLSFSVYEAPDDPTGYELWVKIGITVCEIPLEHLPDVYDMLAYAGEKIMELDDERE